MSFKWVNGFNILKVKNRDGSMINKKSLDSMIHIAIFNQSIS